MFEFSNQITIDGPLSKVFAVATDLTKVPKWNYFVQSVTHTGGAEGQPGSTYHQVRKTDEQDLQIVEIVPDRAFTVETIPPSTPALRRSMRFEASGGSTVIEDHWQLELGVPGLLQPIAGARVRSAVADNLGKLKELIETGESRLQDGRTVTL